MSCYAWNVKEAVIALMIFMGDGSVTFAGQYSTKKQCQAMIEQLVENGISSNAKFLCLKLREIGSK